MCSYNLFRRKGRSELVCAVPEDRPVPAFITGTLWTFGGTLEHPERHRLAFNSEAADASVRVNGFYLFQLTGPLAASFPSRPSRAGCGAPRRSVSKGPARTARPDASRRPAEERRAPLAQAPATLL
jgi:hypothetical protein